MVGRLAGAASGTLETDMHRVCCTRRYGVRNHLDAKGLLILAPVFFFPPGGYLELKKNSDLVWEREIDQPCGLPASPMPPFVGAGGLLAALAGLLRLFHADIDGAQNSAQGQESGRWLL